tara:strand:- start:575 stop:952 length:378 start_codon:yes stop_codon:yes gene_type:complete
MKDKSVGLNWAPLIKANFVFYDRCCELCSHAAWISDGDRLVFAGSGYGAWYRMKHYDGSSGAGPDGMNDSGLQTSPDLNGRPDEGAWSDTIEHGYNLEYQAAKAKRWLGRINSQFNVGYLLEDFS